KPTTEIPGGSVFTTRKPTASEGPSFVTVIAKVVSSPGSRIHTSSWDSVTARSAAVTTGVVRTEELFVEFESVVMLATETAANTRPVRAESSVTSYTNHAVSPAASVPLSLVRSQVTPLSEGAQSQ